MKKGLALVLSLILVFTTFTACGKSGGSKGEAIKTGLGVVTSAASSKNVADADGVAETDSYVAAVTVGSDGKIIDCKLDAAQTQINFSKEGKLTTDLTAALQTKQERGANYGMKDQSGIKKEWNEQADAFAKYCIGKTLDQVKGIAVSKEGTAGDADLASSVTIHIGDFISVVSKAVENAQDLGAKSGDKLGLGINTTIDKSTDAAADTDGLAEAYSYYTAVTVDSSKKITSCAIDASISDIKFNAQGTITTDITAPVQSKQELKDAYGMKTKSNIGKEWYEEANSFAKYVTGKTLDQVKGIAVNDQGTPSDSDLASSVTIHIAPFTGVIDKAVTNAK
ncbi:hypothetical protein SAMN02745136_04980 [Anaerocolumna jejuensis DSM 15929]|uniref:Major membrane immunogen, membrane-anchored lipoprotein n=1 Tax=Anaerocolumna jejuensis DSM 15929 TaxID=1121322 RepID=A0A1M7AZ17_9FIRM|nr:hypothetical protein [Anaerocolumna jejuensis]SHL47649.1 hypothetical protein SAMN02745136_04980 [Anaerocolumna jejuensis DSM 15929]